MDRNFVGVGGDAAFGVPAQETNVLRGPGAHYSPLTNLAVSPVTMNTTVSTDVTERWMSLQDCIEIALKHNFTIQIARYNPALARYNLWGSYGVYDPNFTASIDHSLQCVPGRRGCAGTSFRRERCGG